MQKTDINEKALTRRVKQHVKAKEHEFFAIVQPGFEQIALQELLGAQIGHDHKVIEGGISFMAGLTDCYKCCLMMRSLSRLLMRLKSFRAENFQRFHKSMAAIPWELFVCDGMNINFSIKARKSRLYHTDRLKQEAVDAVSERLNSFGLSVSTDDAVQQQSIYIRFDHDICTVSLDTVGGFLYKRGEKTNVTDAPLRETLAAMILFEAKVKEYDILFDPMCGSGTFSIEAAGISAGALPGLGRSFIFERWPAYSEAAFKHLQESLVTETVLKSKSLEVLACDLDSRAIHATSDNFKTAVSGVQISAPLKKDFLKDEIELPKKKKCLIVLNPPYGTRLKAKGDIHSLYAKIGKRLATTYNECGYAIIVPGPEVEKSFGLHYDRKIIFINGGIKVAVLFKDAFV